jgi:hypothetical protein
MSQLVQQLFGPRPALEHDAGDYKFADAGGHRKTGKPIALWTFNGETSRREDYTNQTSTLYFHIDDENNSAVLVHKGGFLCGGGYVLDGKTGTYSARWRS